MLFCLTLLLLNCLSKAPAILEKSQTIPAEVTTPMLKTTE